MVNYIIRRALQVIPVLLGTTFLLFVLMYLIPGDPVRILTGEKAMDPRRYQQIRHELWLDRPIHIQYLHYLDSLVHLDLGTSYQKGREVKEILMDKFPNSIRLAFAAIFLEVVFGVTIGILSAIKRYSFIDIFVTFASSVLVAVPVFWLGLLLQIFFGVKLSWLPISGMGDSSLRYYILPSVTLAATSIAYVARLMRTQMLEVMRQDYIRTAYSKGLTSTQVVGRHGLKNALIPVVTFIGLDLGALMGGAILTETVFNWPGVGYEIYIAILQRDYPVVLGGVIVMIFVYVFLNLLVDISYAFLDPRIRYGKRED